jgi:GNAT superfamily N-acetyltransferase
MADLTVVKSWSLPPFDPTAEEARMLAEIRARESSGDYSARNPKPGSTAAGAYQFIGPTWQLASKATGAPIYPSAAEAPPAVQDANALYLLRQHGPNAGITWAASGPYYYNQGAPLTVVKSWPLLPGAEAPQAAGQPSVAITIGKPLPAPQDYGEIRMPSAFPGPPPPVAPPAPKTVGGFVENLFTSTGNLIDAMASPILRPVETVQGISALTQAMSEKSGFAPVMGQPHPQPLDAIADIYKQRYGSWQGFKDAWYKDPAGMAADLLTVVDGVGLGFQAANDFAKVAGLSDVAANAVSKAVTAARGTAIGTIKAIPNIPVEAAKGAVIGGLGFQNPLVGAKLGAVNALRKGAAAGRTAALDARARAITEAAEAAEQARAAEVARLRDRLKAIGIPAEPGFNRTGTGELPDLFPRGGGGGTPAPVTPAANAPVLNPETIAAAKNVREFTPEEEALTKTILENVEPQAPTPPPAASSAAPPAPPVTGNKWANKYPTLAGPAIPAYELANRRSAASLESFGKEFRDLTDLQQQAIDTQLERELASEIARSRRAAAPPQNLRTLMEGGKATGQTPERPTSFTTSQGSTYSINGESTTRTKSLHKFHDPADIGEKPPSARTVYVSPEFAQEVGMWNTLSSTGKRIILGKDGKVQLISRGPGGKPGLDRIINDNSFSTTPEVGRAPLELFQPNESGHYAGNHPGNAITRVETAAEAPKVPVSKGMSVEQARGEFEGARKIPSDASFKVVQNPDKPFRWTVQVKSGDKHIGDLELVERRNELNVGLADLTKEYRGQGYGKAMYQEAIKLAQRLGKRYLTSGYSITEDAARVWRSLGAERFSNEPGMPPDDPLSSRWRLPVPKQ